MLPLTTEQINELSTIAFQVARRITGEREAALDIAQEVLIGALDKRLSDPTRLKGYIVRSAMNRAFNAQRDAASHKTILAHNAESVDQYADGDPADQMRTSTLIHGLLEKLATKQKEALTLKFFAEMKIGAIARAMGISEGAVKTHLVRALANLRREITQSEGATR